GSSPGMTIVAAAGASRKTVGPRLPPDELFPPVALHIEQGGEIAVVDPDVSGSGDRGLGVIGNAKAGGFDHAEIVGAVNDHERVEIFEVERFTELDQRGELGGAADDRFSDFAGQLAVLDLQLISAVFLKA